MPMLRPSTPAKKVTVSGKVPETVADDVKLYVEYAGFGNAGQVVAAAVEHVITKDKGFAKWKKARQTTPAAGAQDASDAG